MFSIIGIVLVFGAVLGGFLMEHGKMPVLIQPAELLIIGGSAIGTLLVANPLPLIIKILIRQKKSWVDSGSGSLPSE
jgi:chemotaxis protein MotA